MGLFEELAPYRDKDGLYHSKPVGPDGGPSTGNGLMTTAIAYIFSPRWYGVNWPPALTCLESIQKCRLQPGLYRRSVKQADQEARDDYTALSAVHSAIGDDIRHYGELNRYTYNNVVPGTMWKPKDGYKRKWWLAVLDWYFVTIAKWNRCFVRTYAADHPAVVNEGAMLWHHIDFIPHLKFASMRHKEPPGWFGRLLWCLSLWNVARSNGLENNNAYLLAWLRVYAYKKFFFKYRLCDMAVRYFWKRMDEQGLTMKKIWTAYANDGGEHPFSRYWEDLR